MCPRPSPAHAREEPPTLHPEDVIASARWRERGESGPGSDRKGGGSTALERVPPISFRGRIARAVRAPVVAGAAVFVVAVIVAIGIAVAGSLGGELPAGEAGLSGEGVGTSADADAGASGGEGKVRTDPSSDQSGVDAAAPIFVHVVGAVHSAGVVELTSGARVRDAIEAAGGASDAAVLSGVNLARLVTDGEQLIVPDEETLAAGAASVPSAGASVGASPPGAGEALVNLNTADATLLETLPRVGPALASRIIDWREANGSFASIDQLLEVTGIGAKTLAGFRDRVTV